ncbi:hypothetical protein B296_00001189 [Ensete ventricosum]|uniref:Uncharacterized protein n=1 Tax=Ensete ventricosum TaxID=4639 RepID=A0A426ZKN8_ENSVE|nr:hypothetical protein B296_00001189 [Ensete ventricosum]
MHSVDAVGNLLGVRKELVEGVESLSGWRNGVRQKKIRLTERLSGQPKSLSGLQPDNGPRSSLSIRSGFGRCSGISPKFVRRFTKEIGKLAGNTLGDRRKKTERLTARMPEVAGLAGIESLVVRMPKAAGLAGAAEPPRSWVNRPYPVFPGMFDFVLQKSEATWDL